MPTTWIDTAVVSIIVVAGLFLMYRALKEPMDLLFGMIGKGLRGIAGLISNRASGGYEEIVYG